MSDLIAVPPVFTYISPGLLNNMRREVPRFLEHTYTRSQRNPVAGGFDSWGHQTFEFTNAVVGIPCFYNEKEIPFITPDGLTTLNRPEIIFLYMDPVLEGDIVTNILTLDGELLIPGPMVVEHLSKSDPNLGGAIFLTGTLRDVEFTTT